MITKEFLKEINPKQKSYNPKYSEGTYKFLNDNNLIKVFWNKVSRINGEITNFDPSKIKFYPTQIYFIFDTTKSWLGTSWTNIMSNKYKLYSYEGLERNFKDITEWFCEEYLRIGRCLFDREHTNFLLGENHNYVSDDERFEMLKGIKKCKWCGKVIK